MFRRIALAMLAICLFATGALPLLAPGTSAANTLPTITLSSHAFDAGVSVTVSSSGWDAGTTVEFTTDPAGAPAGIASATADGTGIVADFAILVPADAFAPGTVTPWTLTATGTTGGAAASASDTASVTTPTTTVNPADYAFVYPAPLTLVTLRASTTTSYAVTWTHTKGAQEDALALQTFRGLQAGGSCPSITALVLSTTTTVSGTTARIGGLRAFYCYAFRLVVTHKGVTFTLKGTGVVRILRGPAAIATWTGKYDLYRWGVFSTQSNWVNCVPASVQMMLNIDHHQSDHSATRQQLYYDYGRYRRRYLYNEPGGDPQSQKLTLNHFGPVGYHVIMSKSMTTLLRAVAVRIRMTGSPAGIVVGSGQHAWVINGFAANVDPVANPSYTLGGVYVMGPLWPMQKLRNGYFDPPPDTYYSVATMGKLTGYYHDPKGPTIWDGPYVAIVPEPLAVRPDPWRPRRQRSRRTAQSGSARGIARAVAPACLGGCRPRSCRQARHRA